jgi:hypothetical protein
VAESYQNYRRQKQSKYSGFLIHQFQQNSDTTYRVFDWNRLGIDGKPRQLHVEQSMASIDFNDFEPAMDVPADDNLATCEYFKTDRKSLVSGEMIGNPDPARFFHSVGGRRLLNWRRWTRIRQGAVHPPSPHRSPARGQMPLDDSAGNPTRISNNLKSRIKGAAVAQFAFALTGSSTSPISSSANLL